MSQNMTKIDDNHPMMIEWTHWKQSPDGLRSFYWASVYTVSYANEGGSQIVQKVAQPHLEGAMWNAFIQGFAAGAQAQKEGKI